MKSVYIASAGPNRHKIGISRNPSTRVAALSGASGYKLTLVEQRELPNAPAVERMAHWILRASRLHGEWFSVDAEASRAAVAEAIIRVEAGEQPREVVQAAESDRAGSRWRAWLTEEERVQVAKLDEIIENAALLLGTERRMMANRALQRARYADKIKAAG